MEELRRYASRNHLLVVDIEGDGNCQFRALAHQLQVRHLGEENIDHMTLRQGVVSYLRENPLMVRIYAMVYFIDFNCCAVITLFVSKLSQR